MASFNSVFKGLREYWTPVLSVSKFESDAVLTPEEFVAAGDYLVFKCSTWSWESGDVSKRRDYLPPEKQFLVTRGAPCFKSARELELVAIDRHDASIEGDWFTTTTSAAAEASADSDVDMLEDITASGASSSSSSSTRRTNIDSDANATVVAKSSTSARKDSSNFRVQATPSAATQQHLQSAAATHAVLADIPDMDDLVGNVTEPSVLPYVQSGANAVGSERESASASGAAVSAAQGIMRTRTYDLSISYDKFYQTPRLSLVGYDEARRPLPPSTALQDISSDHANKTVTLEAHPHLNMQVASIHPCRHAEVMKKLIAGLRSSGKTVRADQYLVLFLKFMSSVLPTIDYDHTITLE